MIAWCARNQRMQFHPVDWKKTFVSEIHRHIQGKGRQNPHAPVPESSMSHGEVAVRTFGALNLIEFLNKCNISLTPGVLVEKVCYFCGDDIFKLLDEVQDTHTGRKEWHKWHDWWNSNGYDQKASSKIAELFQRIRNVSF